MAEIFNLDDYRRKKEAASDSSDDFEFSDSEKEIMDGLVASHPAARAIARKNLYKNPDLVEKVITGLLVSHHYPEEVIKSVASFRRHLESQNLSEDKISEHLIDKFKNHIST